MVNADSIKPHTPVVGSNDREIAVVDHLEGLDIIKLAKDEHGVHHYIPVSWVNSVDDKIHLDRSDEQAKREWSETFPNLDTQVSS